MVDLGPFADDGVLGLDEIADLAARGEIRARTQARERADLGILADGRALYVRKRPDARARAHADAGSEPDIGLERRARRDARVMVEEHGRGRGHGDAVPHQGVPSPVLPDGLRLGQFGHGVDAEHVGGRCLDGANRQVPRAGDLDRIGQVEFALGIVVADGGQQFGDMGPRKGHEPAIAQADPALVGACILVFADRGQLAVGFDQPAVAGRIVGPEADDDEVRAGRKFRARPAQRFGRHEGRVAEQDEHIVEALPDGRQRGRHRVGGAEPLPLDEEPHPGPVRAQPLADPVAAMPDDHGQAPAARGARAGRHMGDHRQAGDRMQHLGQVRFHALAGAGGQNDGQAGACHGRFPFGPCSRPLYRLARAISRARLPVPAKAGTAMPCPDASKRARPPCPMR